MHELLEKSLPQVHKELRGGKDLWSTPHMTLSAHRSWVNPDIRVFSLNAVTLLWDYEHREEEVDEMLAKARKALLEDLDG